MSTVVVRENAKNWFAVYYSHNDERKDVHVETDRLIRLREAVVMAKGYSADRFVIQLLGESEVVFT